MADTDQLAAGIDGLSLAELMDLLGSPSKMKTALASLDKSTRELRDIRDEIQKGQEVRTIEDARLVNARQENKQSNSVIEEAQDTLTFAVQEHEERVAEFESACAIAQSGISAQEDALGRANSEMVKQKTALDKRAQTLNLHASAARDTMAQTIEECEAMKAEARAILADAQKRANTALEALNA